MVNDHLSPMWIEQLRLARHLLNQQPAGTRNPWVDKDISSMLRYFLKNMHNANFLEQLYTSLIDEDEGISEVMALLTTTP